MSSLRECCRTTAIIKKEFDHNIVKYTEFKCNSKDIFPCPGRSHNILKHIRECCGYEDFFQELAKLNETNVDDLLQRLEDEDEDEFVIFLGFVLTKEFKETDTYDSFFNCIPFIKDFLDKRSTIKLRDSDSANGEIPGRDFIALDTIRDLFTCKMEVDYFYKLIPSIGYCEFMVSDLEEAEAYGNELPEGLQRLCKQVGEFNERIVSDMDLEGYKPFLLVDISMEFTGKKDGGEEVLELYRVFPRYKSILQESSVRKGHILPFMMKSCLSKEELDTLTDVVPKTKVNDLFDIACRCGHPVYIDTRRVEIIQTRNKSARK